MFEERKLQAGFWFTEEFTPEQQESFLDFLLQRCCNAGHLKMVRSQLERVPVTERNPTNVLPRALCLRIFSYLDPRSLSRASSVCWPWLEPQPVLWPDPGKALLIL